MSSNENPAAAAYGGVWLDANRYYDAERRHYELTLAELAAQQAEVRKRANPGTPPKSSVPNGDMEISQPAALKKLERFEKEQAAMKNQIEQITSDLDRVLSKLSAIEKAIPLKASNLEKFLAANTPDLNSLIQNGASDDEDDDLDLFGSDEEDDEAAEKLREERLQAYVNKKAKKPALVAKSSVVLDVKPWDDETDMKAMEKAVREIQTDGLVWGASKLVPLAYGINKLQLVAIVEDEKVSIDWLQETISEIEELVQSVDIAAFNKL